MAEWTLTLFLDWEGGRPWRGQVKNQRRWCFTLEGHSYLEVHIQDRKGRNFYMFCDPEDLPLIEAHTWSIDERAHATYAVTQVRVGNGRERKYYHALKRPEWPLVDHHPNRNGLDNRSVNLRDGSEGANQRNMSMHSDNTSEVTGVSYYNRDKCWIAEIGKKGSKYGFKRKTYLGPHDKNHESFHAAVAQRRAWEKEFGYSNG